MSQVLIKRCGDSGEFTEFASQIAVTKSRENQLLTAIRTKAGRLKLISWQIQRKGMVARLDDSGDEGLEVSCIDIARGKKTITSISDSSKNLHLISWSIDRKGKIKRIGKSGIQQELVDEIKIAMISNTMLVTACRTDENQLKLISWRLKQDGDFTRLDEALVPSLKVSEICIQVIAVPGCFVTPVITDQNLLKLISWSVSSRGKLIILGDSGFQAGRATIIRSVYSDPNLITSGRAGNGRLKLIAWRIADNGKTITRFCDSGDQAGLITDNSLMSLHGKLVSAVRTSSDHLKLIAWHLSATGTITRIGDSGLQDDRISQVTLSREVVNRKFPIVTALQYLALPRTAPLSDPTNQFEGGLRLITWKG